MAHGGKRPGAGKKPGTVASHTLEAAKAKESLVRAYVKEKDKINAVLIRKAKKGDMFAIKELHDRVWGRAVQPLSNDPENPLFMTPEHKSKAKKAIEQLLTRNTGQGK